MTTEIEQSKSNVFDSNNNSEASVFAENKVAFERIHILASMESDIESMDKALTELRTIFDKYLEIPSLLDRYMEEMVFKLAEAAQSHMANPTNLTEAENFADLSLPRIFSALYALSKVRGRKRVQRFLPHQVADIEPVLKTMQIIDQRFCSVKDMTIDSATLGVVQTWESMYVLWNWMGMLSLVPFDSTIVVEEKQISDLVKMGKKYLSEAGPTREMASACLASWLSRPDFEAKHLEDFKEWSIGVLNDFLDNQRNIFQTMGVLQTLVTVIKVSNADRENLLRFVTPLWPAASKISESKPSNLLLRKYLVKWWTRTGMVYMPPRVAAWRYQHSRRSLKENLSKPPGKEANTSTEVTQKDEGVDQFFLVPDEVEDALGEVIEALTDSSTVVRWSAAKGIGRITERLPAICGDDVLDALLKLFDDVEKDNHWHGACLALAELARRGLLLPKRLHTVMPKIVEAIHFDVPRRQTSVGAHVRDAACYVYWAIARSYTPDIMKPFVKIMSQSIVTAFLFDREVNCRRAASASFQELVGRQGATNFKHGISILTTADYFTLGNRSEAYISIAAFIAKYDEYKKPIIDHLYSNKLQHWDPSVRLLSAQSLGNLVSLDTEAFVSTVIPYLLENSLEERNVQLRHGSVLGLAEVVLAYGAMRAENGTFEGLLSEGILQSIADLVPAIEKKRLYRGRGGEQMREAVCRLVECISIANIPLSVPLQVRLLDSVDACIPHPNEVVQEQAGNALFALMRCYFPVSTNGPSERLQKRVVDKYVKQVKTSINPAATRGFTMALGRLPAKLLAPSSKVLDQSLGCLCRSSRPESTVGNDKDAETRRNALIALSRICKTVGLPSEQVNNLGCKVGLSSKQTSHVFTALFRGLNDYNMERRGDVGSMSRIAAMHGLVSMAYTLSSGTGRTLEYFDQDTCKKIIGGLLKQLSEKLDAVRSEAGRCLENILTSPSTNTVPFIQEEDQLKAALGLDTKANDGINWADAASTFPLVVKVLDISEYFEFIVSGLVISVGCLTQSVAREATSSLVQWLRRTTSASLDRFGEAILELFEKHKREGRVLLPLLKTISTLIDRVCIERLVDSTFFSSKLLKYIQEEQRGCSDVHRLNALIDVSLGLLARENGVQQDLLAFLCGMLAHRFPRIRRLTAENLYVKLLETPDMEDDHPALGLLLGTTWDGDVVDTLALKAKAGDVARALGVDGLFHEV